jgi:hypothetical protein
MGTEFIQSAHYGDENSMKRITHILKDKVLGTTLDISVDEKLIPPFEVAEKTELNTIEVEKIRKEASKSCGGADQDCINATEARLRQAELAEKERKANTSAGVIKGRRLTLNLVDENGKLRRVIVPDGQKLKLDNVSVVDPKTGGSGMPSMQYFQNQLYLIAGVIVATVVYVFGVLATYTVFAPRFGLPIAIPLTVISVFIPYSGYIMIFFYFMGMSAVDTYVNSQ